MRASTMACTTATPRKSALPWQTDWRVGSGEVPAPRQVPEQARSTGSRENTWDNSDDSVSQVLLAKSGPNQGVQATASSVRSYLDPLPAAPDARR